MHTADDIKAATSQHFQFAVSNKNTVPYQPLLFKSENWLEDAECIIRDEINLIQSITLCFWVVPKLKLFSSVLKKEPEFFLNQLYLCV